MPAETETDRSPHPIDLHVGRRIRERRKALGVSQERLAEELGLTFQQVQKYERGANRVSSSKLWQIAGALHVSLSSFFEGLEGESVAAVQEAGETFVHDMPATPETLELMALLGRMDARRRRMLLDLARTLAETAAPADAAG